MMALEIIDCEQNTPEWDRLRSGLVTASQFHVALMSGRGGKESLTRRKYLYRLAAARLGAQPGPGFSNAHTERGHTLEAEARDLYAFTYDVDPCQVGFLRDGDIGGSPDAFLGDDGILEIKTKLPELEFECWLKGEFPAEHKAQAQGLLWLSTRSYIDLVSYWPGMPLFVRRAERDEAYIAKLKVAVDDFLDELRDLVNQGRKWK